MELQALAAAAPLADPDAAQAVVGGQERVLRDRREVRIDAHRVREGQEPAAEEQAQGARHERVHLRKHVLTTRLEDDAVIGCALAAGRDAEAHRQPFGARDGRVMVVKRDAEHPRRGVGRAQPDDAPHAHGLRGEKPADHRRRGFAQQHPDIPCAEEEDHDPGGDPEVHRPRPVPRRHDCDERQRHPAPEEMEEARSGPHAHAPS